MYSSQSTSLVIVAVILVLLASVAVALRFKVRSNVKTGRGPDDWIILGALLVQYATMSVAIYGAVAGGHGDTLENLSRNPEEGKRWARVLFAIPMLFAISITLIKASTLVFYRRLFTTGRYFQRACILMFGLTVGWFLTSILGQFFSCRPISDSWTFFKDRSGHCPVGIPDFQLSMAAINLIFDIVIVCMPLFVISKLQMDAKRKWAVGGIFALGAFCIVASIVRLYCFARLSSLSPRDASTLYTQTVTNTILWTFTECCTSIIAACLPTLAPLLRDSRKLDSVIRTVRSRLGLRSSTSRITSSDRHPRTGNARSFQNNNAASYDTWQQFDSGPHIERGDVPRSDDDDRVFRDKPRPLADARAFQLQVILPSKSQYDLRGDL